jgi:hypothetical protein
MTPARAEEAEAGSMTASDRPSTMKPMNDLGTQKLAFSFVAGIYTMRCSSISGRYFLHGRSTPSTTVKIVRASAEQCKVAHTWNKIRPSARTSDNLAARFLSSLTAELELGHEMDQSEEIEKVSQDY